jgi:hypothetical protein
MVIFDKIIIGKGKSVKIDLIVIHKSKLEPELKALGEIANCKISKSYEDEGGDTDWTPWIGIFYIIIVGFLLFFLIYFTTKGINWLVFTILKRRFLRKYNYPYKSPTDSQIAIAEIYATVKKTFFRELLNIFTNTEEIRRRYEKENKIVSTVTTYNKLKKEKKIYSKDKEDVTYESDFLKALAILKNNNLIEKMDDDAINVKQDFLEEVVRTEKLLVK